MKIGTSKLLDGYQHIYMLNGYSLPKDKNTVFKYMPLERFVKSVDENELVFVNPENWYDPFERLYYGIDCSAKGYHTEHIACMCVSEKSSTNEDASWRVYSDSSSKAVRLSIEKSKLFSILDNYAKQNGYRVYIGQVKYDFKKKDIIGLHNHKSPHYAEYFPNDMKREHYLSLMLLKRSAFKYENEVRVFLVKDIINFDSNKLLRIPCDYTANKLVSNIMLAPYPPIRGKGDYAWAVRQKINTMESEEIKRMLTAKVGCKIQQSQLYKIYPRIEKA